MTKKIVLSYTQRFVARAMPYCFYLITEIEDILSRLDDVSRSMEENSRFLVWDGYQPHWNLERERAWNIGYEKKTSRKKPLANTETKGTAGACKEACGVYFSFCNFVCDTTSNIIQIMQWCPCHGFRLQFGTFLLWLIKSAITQ